MFKTGLSMSRVQVFSVWIREPQSIHNAKDRRAECQHYIETWVKESQREVYLGAYLNQ